MRNSPEGEKSLLCSLSGAGHKASIANQRNFKIYGPLINDRAIALSTPHPGRRSRVTSGKKIQATNEVGGGSVPLGNAFGIVSVVLNNCGDNELLSIGQALEAADNVKTIFVDTLPGPTEGGCVNYTTIKSIKK
jgi:hypothetical protein